MDQFELEIISNLKEGESFTVPESDYGKAEIWVKYDTYFLFSIPLFGGQPVFERSYPRRQVSEMIDFYNSWT